jgi:hypothetical protein
VFCNVLDVSNVKRKVDYGEGDNEYLEPEEAVRSEDIVLLARIVIEVKCQ